MAPLAAISTNTPNRGTAIIGNPHTNQLLITREKAPMVLELEAEWNYTTGDDVRSSPAVADIDGDGEKEIVIGSSDGNVYCLNKDGGKQWNCSTGDSIWSSPAIGDIDGDGQLEIVVGSYDHNVYCLSGSGVKEWNYTMKGLVHSTPAISDLDGDGCNEVIVGTGGNYEDSDGRICCLNGTGGLKWSYQTGSDGVGPYGPLGSAVYSSPAIADIDGDGDKEVVVGGTLDGMLYCLSSRGEYNWCINACGYAQSSPAVADIDEDNDLEVVYAASQDVIFYLSGTGEMEKNCTIGGHVWQSSPTIADLDQDGHLEVLVGAYDGIHCLNMTCQEEWYFHTGNIVESSPAVADIDGDHQPEVVVGCMDANVYCLNQAGRLEYNYSIGRDWVECVYSSPTVIDIDGDGQLEIIVGSDDRNIYCLSVVSAPYDPSAYPWPSIGFHCDTLHSGSHNDTDGDGLTDAYEVTSGTEPGRADTDDDGLTDYDEFLLSTNPLIPVGPDTTPPVAVTDLATGNPTQFSIELTWTAPGDNGRVGTAEGYVVKFSTTGPITASNWDSAVEYAQSWSPLPAGNSETHLIKGLTPDTTYWFAVKAYDDALPPNYSGISNCPSESTVTGVILNFNAYHEGSYYSVDLWVPFSNYDSLTSLVEGLSQNYPLMDLSLLREIYYMYRYIEDPDGFPILSVSILKDGQKIHDSGLKGEIVEGLLIYSYTLMAGTSSARLTNYRNLAQQYWQEYYDKIPAVVISDAISKAAYFLTIIGPIIDDLRQLLGAEWRAEVVETSVSLLHDLLSGYETMLVTHGEEKTNSILDILVYRGFISSKTYNPMDLYRKLIENPSTFIKALKDINSQVLKLNWDASIESKLSAFIDKLKEGIAGELLSSGFLGLYAFLGKGLALKTAYGIAAASLFEGMVCYAIPIALAYVVYTSYIKPMSQAVYCCSESLRCASDLCYGLYGLGLKMADPHDNVLNLTTANQFASLYGLTCINEYYYYSLGYYIRSHQWFVSSSELDDLESSSEEAISKAKDWKNMLDSMHSCAVALVNGDDPVGTSFDFTLLPLANILPAVPANSSGFVVIVNSTSNIIIQSGSYSFIVQNRMWLSNFTYSLYVDDQDGYSYLIVFNPPDGRYGVKTENAVLISLVNFRTSGENVALSSVLNTTTSNFGFDVSGSTGYIPADSTGILLIGVVIASVASITVAIYVKKRR